jgi:hypothetical protein
MVKLSSNKKSNPASAISSGTGKRNRARRPNAQQQNGSVMRPMHTTILNATPYGKITLSATIISAGTTM